MNRVKEIYKSFILEFSEIIWVYYIIVLFASDEWGEPAYFDLTWFIISAFLGYSINLLLSRFANKNLILMVLANAFVLGSLIVQNWRSVVTQGHLTFGLAVSIGITFLFLRSARLAFRSPKRQEILYHFEGNVLLYIFLAVFFIFRGWANNTFHIFFIFSIISSLIGMILTLQSHENSENNQDVKIIKVGQSGWFTGVMATLLVCIPIFSFLFLLPSVNKTLHAIGIGFWETFKKTLTIIGNFIVWFLSLLPVPDQEIIDDFEDSPLVQNLEGSELEAVSSTIPFFWIIVGIGIVIVLIVIWLVVKSNLKRMINSSAEAKNLVITKGSWWLNFKDRIKKYLYALNLKWRSSFKHFYKHPIYWYYYQVSKWGRKNHIVKAKYETSQEYIQKIISIIPKDQNIINDGRNYQLSELLSRLNNAYQAAYYGQYIEMIDEEDYKLLVDFLRKSGKELLIDLDGARSL